MKQIIALSVLHVQPLALTQALRTPPRIKEMVSKDPGVLSYTVFQKADDPTELITVMVFVDVDAANELVVRIAKNPIYAESLKLFSTPPDIKRMKVTTCFGRDISDLNVGEFLSVSHRFAEPGMTDEMEDELEGIFQELQNFDGFIGSIQGTNEALDEELIGLAFWSETESFEKSIPKRSMYKVDLYKKIV